MRKVLYIIISILLIVSITGIEIEAEESWEEKIIIIEELYEEIEEADEQQHKELLEEIVNISADLVEEYPENPQVYLNAAENYYNYSQQDEDTLKILEKGQEYAEKAVELAPNKAESHYWVAAYIGEIGRERGIMESLSGVEPMKESLERAIELDPEYAAAYDVLAQLYTQAPGWPISIGDDEQALEYRKKSVEFAPDNYTYRWRLYEDYLDVGKIEEGEQILKELINELEDKEELTEDNREIKEKARETLEN